MNDDVRKLCELVDELKQLDADDRVAMLALLDKIENRIVELEKTLEAVNDAWQQERQMVAELA